MALLPMETEYHGSCWSLVAGTHHSLLTHEKKCHGDAFQADCCVKMLFLLQFYYDTETSRSWLTCWKWTAMMTLQFHQQNCVNSNGSWWWFLWPFLWFWFIHSAGILCRIGNLVKTLWKKLLIVVSFIVKFTKSLWWIKLTWWCKPSVSIQGDGNGIDVVSSGLDVTIVHQVILDFEL